MKLNAVLLIIAVALAPIAFAADGAATYKAKCASCHGADGKGQSPMGKKMNLRDLGSPEVQKQTDKELYDWTADGKGKMPAYKDKLSADEIKALVAHMRTFKK
ncbi:MAG TPA: cytochrome c [Thermoanaerobaculia bacterium]|jgi:cytochrome c6|nr:cytochrome c [Thermoanaerobaculia bacterium]